MQYTNLSHLQHNHRRAKIPERICALVAGRRKQIRYSSSHHKNNTWAGELAGLLGYRAERCKLVLAGAPNAQGFERTEGAGEDLSLGDCGEILLCKSMQKLGICTAQEWIQETKFIGIIRGAGERLVIGKLKIMYVFAKGNQMNF